MDSLIVALIRVKSTETGVLGSLTLNGKELCKTLELPWKDNAPQISCIPVGTYECQPWDSIKFPNVWEITDVPDRVAILIHNANTPNQIKGCVAVGMTYGVFDGVQGVARSREALNFLRQTLPPKFTLKIS